MDIYWNGDPIGATTNNSGLRIDFDNQLIVQDEIRGYLIYRNGGWNLVGFAQYQNCGNPLNRIALILESPHRDEYSNLYVPLRPANGCTGRNINNRICQAIQRQHALDNSSLSNILSQNVDYEIYLMNPVPVQASCYHEFHGLGHNPALNGLAVNRKNTNQVFRRLFSPRGANFRNDFINRLNNYQPDIIYNCCTSYLRSLVDNAIRDSNYNNTLYHNTHPSVW